MTDIAERRKRDTVNAGYILSLKTLPSRCGISCPCNEGREEDSAEIEADVLFDRTADAGDRGEQ